MKYLSGYDNIFETGAWYFWGNRKVRLGYLDWGPGTNDRHSDPADKIFLGQCIVSNVLLAPILFWKAYLSVTCHVLICIMNIKTLYSAVKE